MKKIIMAICVLFSVSCSKDLESLNVDVKNASTASGETFFTYGVKSLFDVLSSPGYEVTGGMASLAMGQLWAQHVTAVTYTNVSNYYFTGTWQDLYVNVIKNLRESSRVIAATNPVLPDDVVRKNNMIVINEILEIQTFAFLVETFGDIPYSEALDIENVLPKYDKEQFIHENLISRLQTAITKLNTTGGSFTTGDPVYNGNVMHWKKYANSLLLKLGMRLADVNPTLAKSTVQAAFNDTYLANSENAKLTFQSSTPNTNRLWVNTVLGNRKDVVIAEPLINVMNAINDPRREILFTKKGGLFVGGAYGQVITFDSYSNYNTMFQDPTLPQILLDYATVEFLKAEAAERSFVGTPADAEVHYNNAITASCQYYGVDLPSISNYLAQSSVAYTTATGTWQQKIGNQKWIALFRQGYKAYTEFRRLDYPTLVPPATGTFINSIPARATYPISEQNLNGANYKAASNSIGGDLLTTKLYWDIH